MGILAYLKTTTILRDGNYAPLFPIPVKDTRAEEIALVREKLIQSGMSAEAADRAIHQMETKTLSALELVGLRSVLNSRFEGPVV